jgi:glutamine amidotransferase
MMATTCFDLAKHKAIVDNFFGLALKGKVPPKNAPGHLDGWGIGWHQNSKARILKSGNSIIREKARFYSALRRIGKARILMLHLRKAAWDKTARQKHAHPFLFKGRLFSHNGTIFDYEKLLPKTPKQNRPGPGALDTEVYFRYLLKGFPEKFKKSIKFIKEHNAYSSLSFLMSDGRKLYAFRQYSKWPAYYTLFKARAGSSTVIASEPLDKTFAWKLMKPGKLAVTAA